MNQQQWKVFCDFKEEFRQKVSEWNDRIPELKAIQKQAAELAGTPSYPFETAVVYNTDLDKITADDDIKLIVIGDNPGKDEQLQKNNRYLCGQAGKLGERFFTMNPSLGIDFRKNVIILNKTPVHSAKTNQLKTMMKIGGEKVCQLINESQLWMAEKTSKLHQELETPELWLVGYSELKDKGFFIPYRQKLKETYDSSAAWEKVFVFQHFSMNRFTIDLGDYVKKNQLNQKSLLENLHSAGLFHKNEIFI